MRHTVPKFIEHEAKIVGPLTFKQFCFVGGAGAICFIVYFSAPFLIFIFTSIILVGGSLALAFLKVGGHPLPIVIKNFLGFSTSPKMYIWKKKMIPPKMAQKPKPETGKEVEEAPVPKVAEKSRLEKISGQIETGLR